MQPDSEPSSEPVFKGAQHVCWCLAWLVSERLRLIDGAAAGTRPEVRKRDPRPPKFARPDARERVSQNILNFLKCSRIIACSQLSGLIPRVPIAR